MDYLICPGKECLAGWRQNCKQLFEGMEWSAQLKVNAQVSKPMDVRHKGGVVVWIEPETERICGIQS